MSAQDYFRSDTPGRPDTNRPLPSSPGGPYQTPFPPAHTGYNDDLSYASTHYSKHSIDDTYDSPYNNNHSPQKSPYTESIPLQNRPSAGSSTAYMGAAAAESGRPYSTHPLGDPNLTTRVRRARPKKRRPWFVYTLTLIEVAVFCWQLARQAQLTGSPIATKPQFNPMIGPSFGGIINMGARYSPCMKEVKNLGSPDKPSLTFDEWLEWPCPKHPEQNNCNLRELCGFNGNNMPQIEATGTDGTRTRTPWKFPDGKKKPNQWYRFIIPVFLHAGLIHLLFNMFVQVTLGGDMERQIGTLRFGLIYIVSGIFSFVFSGNLGGQAQATVGASGSLFGIFALTLLSILYNWQELPSPMRDLLFLILDIVISFVLGLLPFIDNFAHIGGFISGLALGIVFMRSPSQLQKRLDSAASNPPYTAATPSNPYNTSSGDANLSGFTGFVKQPLGFFKGRKPLWWVWWLVRAAMLAAILGAFIGLLNNFYVKDKTCSWCKYLSCLPVNGWCEMFDLKVETKTENVRRAVEEAGRVFERFR